MLRKWHLKAVIQKGISLLPASQKVNYLFQKHVTHGLDLTDDLFFDRLGHAIEHLKAWEKHGQGALRSSFELGTGWYPIVPFAMYLAGTDRVVTADIDRLCTAKQCILLAQMYLRQQKSGKLPEVLCLHADRLARMQQVADATEQTPLTDLLATLQISYLTADVSQPQPDIGQFDLVTSNNTFEHIYPEVLEPILRNLHDMNRVGGIQSHFIDLSDHYAHMDSSINVYHFLRYSDAAWRWIDNSVQPMNRWRMADFRALYKQIGATILEENHRPGDLAALRTIPLAERFRKYPDAEIAISHGYLVSVLDAKTR